MLNQSEQCLVSLVLQMFNHLSKKALSEWTHMAITVNGFYMLLHAGDEKKNFIKNLLE